MKIKKLLAAVLSLGMVFSLAACAADVQAEKTMSDSTVKQYNLNGVVLITKNGKTLYRYASGTADYENGTQINGDTLFCIGSVSKQFTAVCVLMLEERGLLSVDDTLDKYFPGYRYGSQITLKNLLSMRSGIAEFYEVSTENGAYTETPAGSLKLTVTNSNSVEKNRENLKNWLFAQPLVFEPGSACEYTNSNYFLLATIVEIVSGQKYEDFVTENIFKPLNMKNSGFIDSMLGSKKLAKSPVECATVYVGVTMGLGDIISNAADMDLWLCSLRENTLISRESFKEMRTNHSADLEDESYGYGLIPHGDGSVHHSGFFKTYTAYDYTFPEKGYNLFAVTNDLGGLKGNLSALCQQLIKDTLE